jgi:hypothetical protein
VPHHIQNQPPTVAILGSNTLGEHVLALLLEGEGYAVKLLKTPPTAASTAVPPQATP